jgi:hypothetical protein
MIKRADEKISALQSKLSAQLEFTSVDGDEVWQRIRKDDEFEPRAMCEFYQLLLVKSTLQLYSVISVNISHQICLDIGFNTGV